MTLRSTRVVIGWLVLLLSLGHIYFVYPLPAQRVESMRLERTTPTTSPIDPSTKLQTNPDQQRLEGFSSNESLERFFWESWVAGFLMLMFGAATGLYTLYSKSQAWKWLTLAFSGFYVAIYWWFTVLPIGKGPSDFISFELLTLRGVFSLNDVGRVFMQIHQMTAAVVFHLLFVFCLISLISKRNTRGAVTQ
jgi:hypothetical protein